jgi:hypothetical protein
MRAALPEVDGSLRSEAIGNPCQNESLPAAFRWRVIVNTRRSALLMRPLSSKAREAANEVAKRSGLSHGRGVGNPGSLSEFPLGHGATEERAMPVIILWAIPAVFVLGGVTYLLVK